MKRLVDMIGMTVGGWVGWAAGRPVSFFTAFMLGILGTGVGMYLGRRAAHQLLP